MVKTIAPLQLKGYVVPGIENVGSRAPATNQLRYFREEDRPVADSIARTLDTESGFKVQVVQSTGSKNVRPKQFEIWCGQSWQ